MNWKVKPVPYTRPKANWRVVQEVACDLLVPILQMSRDVESSRSPKVARAMVNEQFDTLIWKYSEAAGKCRGNPLWSHMAVGRYRANTLEKKKKDAGLVHEHAFPKSAIIRQVTQPGLTDAEAVALFRAMCVGAVVTKEPEDALLKSAGLNSSCPEEAIAAGHFWARYECARAAPQAPADAFVFVDHPGLEEFYRPGDLAHLRAAGMLRP